MEGRIKGGKRKKEKLSLLKKSNRTKTSDTKGTLRNTHMKKTLGKIQREQLRTRVFKGQKNSRA